MHVMSLTQKPTPHIRTHPTIHTNKVAVSLFSHFFPQVQNITTEQFSVFK